MDGMIGKKIKFEDWKGDTRTGEVVSILRNGDYEVSTDRGMALVKNAEIIKMRKGGYVPKSVQMKREKVAKVMHEFKERKLHSGSKNGPIVKDRDQAIAIALSEANSKKMGRGGDLPSIKGLKKLNAKRFHQGTDYIYHDMTTDKFYFVDFEGDVMEIKNDYFLSEIKKFYKMEKSGEMGWKHKMAKGGGVNSYQESKYLTKEQWEKWNEYVKTGKIDGKKESNFFAVARWVGTSGSAINAYEMEQRRKRLPMAEGGFMYARGGKTVDFSVMYFSPEWKNKSYSEKVEIETKRLDAVGIKIGDIVMNPEGMSGVVTLYNEKQSNRLDSPIMVKLDKPSAIVFGSDKGWIGGYYLYLRKGFMATGGGVKEADTIMYVELQSVGNSDYGDAEEKRKNIAVKKVYVESIEEAQGVVRQFIDRHDLGGGNWTGGKVFKDGKNIGFIAYNGRFFEGVRPYANGGSTSDQYNVSIDWEQNKPKLKYGRKFFKNIYANSNEEAENFASEQWNSVKANSNKKVLSINSINMTELRKKPILDKPERKMTTGGGVKETKTKMGKIKISDIEIGAKFKAKSGTVFIVDSTDGKIVESSLEGGAKGNYRDPIGEFVAFMNEQKATRVMATGGSMYAEGGGVGNVVNKYKESLDYLNSQGYSVSLLDIWDVKGLYNVTDETALKILDEVREILMPYELVKRTIHNVAQNNFGLEYDDYKNDEYADGGGVGEWSNGFSYGSLVLKNTNIYIRDNGGKVNRGRYDIYAKTPQPNGNRLNLLNSFNDLEEAKKYGYDYSEKYATGGSAGGNGNTNEYEWISFWWGGKSSRKLTKEEADSKGVKFENYSTTDGKKWWNYAWVNWKNKGMMASGGSADGGEIKVGSVVIGKAGSRIPAKEVGEIIEINGEKAIVNWRYGLGVNKTHKISELMYAGSNEYEGGGVTESKGGSMGWKHKMARGGTSTNNLSDLEKKILTELNLQGYWGKSGNLTTKQRLKYLQGLQNKGYIDSNVNLTPKGKEAINPYN